MFNPWKAKDKLGLIKIINFYFIENAVKNMKRQATDQGKIFTNHISNKGLAYIIYKKLSKLNNNETNNLVCFKGIKV